MHEAERLDFYDNFVDLYFKSCGFLFQEDFSEEKVGLTIE